MNALKVNYLENRPLCSAVDCFKRCADILQYCTLMAIFEAVLQIAASLRPSRLPSTSNFLKPNQPFPFDRLLGRKFMEFNGRPSQLITDCVEISRSVDGL